MLVSQNIHCKSLKLHVKHFEHSTPPFWTVELEARGASPGEETKLTFYSHEEPKEALEITGGIEKVVTLFQPQDKEIPLVDHVLQAD